MHVPASALHSDGFCLETYMKIPADNRRKHDEIDIFFLTFLEQGFIFSRVDNMSCRDFFSCLPDNEQKAYCARFRSLMDDTFQTNRFGLLNEACHRGFLHYAARHMLNAYVYSSSHHSDELELKASSTIITDTGNIVLLNGKNKLYAEIDAALSLDDYLFFFETSIQMTNSKESRERKKRNVRHTNCDQISVYCSSPYDTSGFENDSVLQRYKNLLWRNQFLLPYSVSDLQELFQNTECLFDD